MSVKPLTIKDPIHGYIELDRLEAAIVDSRWFQRMKHVRQNDVSASVYPTMQGTRFEHSLGVMHIAGKCMRMALEKDTDDSKEFIKQFKRELDVRHRSLSSCMGSSDATLIELAVRVARLYGALHDIGHPPYSHLLERSISFEKIDPENYQLYKKEADKWHEINGGLIVSEYLLSDCSIDFSEHEQLRLACVKALASKTGEVPPALKSIQQLVDAVIDTDRMDFVLRDGRTSASDFGIYDINRLIQSFRILVDNRGTTLPAEIFIRPSSSALSAIESLLQERQKIYRWVHFHHRVILTKALMRFVIGHLVTGISRNHRIERSYFQAKNYAPDIKSKLPYIHLGDSYIDELLVSSLKFLERKARRNTIEERIRTALRILLLREKNALSAWKRLDEFAEFDRILNAKIAATIRARPDEKRIREKHHSVANWLADFDLSKKQRTLISKLQEKLNSKIINKEEDWYLIELTEGFSTRGSDWIVSEPDSKMVPLSALSSVAEAIERAWKRDIHFYAFRISPQLWTDREDELESCRGESMHAVADSFIELYESDGKLRSGLNEMIST